MKVGLDRALTVIVHLRVLPCIASSNKQATPLKAQSFPFSEPARLSFFYEGAAVVHKWLGASAEARRLSRWPSLQELVQFFSSSAVHGRGAGPEGLIFWPLPDLHQAIILHCI
jgi:hypothetical protein